MADDSRVKQFSGAQLSVEENYLLDWILDVLKVPQNERPQRNEKTGSALYSTLTNGILLCRLINEIAPGSIKKIHPATRPAFAQIENIGFFSSEAVKLGVHSSQLFDAPDLRDAARRNRTKVVATLKALALIANEKGIQPQFKNDETILSIGRILDDDSIKGSSSSSSSKPAAAVAAPSSKTAPAAPAATSTAASTPASNTAHSTPSTSTAVKPPQPRPAPQPVHHYVPPTQPKHVSAKPVAPKSTHHYVPPKITPLTTTSAPPLTTSSVTRDQVIQQSESGLDELLQIAAKMEHFGVDEEGRIKTPRLAVQPKVVEVPPPKKEEPEDEDIVKSPFPVFDFPLNALKTDPIDDFLAAVRQFEQEQQA